MRIAKKRDTDLEMIFLNEPPLLYFRTASVLRREEEKKSSLPVGRKMNIKLHKVNLSNEHFPFNITLHLCSLFGDSSCSLADYLTHIIEFLVFFRSFPPLICFLSFPYLIFFLSFYPLSCFLSVPSGLIKRKEEYMLILNCHFYMYI